MVSIALKSSVWLMSLQCVEAVYSQHLPDDLPHADPTESPSTRVALPTAVARVPTGGTVAGPTMDLISASTVGNIDQVIYLLLQKDVNVDNTSEYHGHTALIGASLFGHKKIVDILLKAKASVDKKDAGGSTALMKAASENHPEVVRTLLAHGASVSEQDGSGCTALMIAAQAGHKHVVEALLEYGSVTEHDVSQVTALDLALWCAHKDVVEVLLAHTSIDREKSVGDQISDDYTPLMKASAMGRTDIVTMLLDHDDGPDINERSKKGLTSLMVASMRGKEAVVQILLERGANERLRDCHDRTASFYAETKGYQNIVKLLRNSEFDNSMTLLEASSAIGDVTAHVPNASEDNAALLLQKSVADWKKLHPLPPFGKATSAYYMAFTSLAHAADWESFVIILNTKMRYAIMLCNTAISHFREAIQKSPTIRRLSDQLREQLELHYQSWQCVAEHFKAWSSPDCRTATYDIRSLAIALDQEFQHGFRLANDFRQDRRLIFDEVKDRAETSMESEPDSSNAIEVSGKASLLWIWIVIAVAVVAISVGVFYAYCWWKRQCAENVPKSGINPETASIFDLEEGRGVCNKDQVDDTDGVENVPTDPLELTPERNRVGCRAFGSSRDLDSDLAAAYPRDRHGNFLTRPSDGPRDSNNRGPLGSFLRDVEALLSNRPQPKLKPKLKKKVTIDFRTAIPSYVKGTKMPYGDPSDINPPAPTQQPPATGSNEPPPGWNAPQPSQQSNQQNGQDVDETKEGHQPTQSNTVNAPRNSATEQQNLLYHWSHPVQGPDMPTPTVFRNDGTHHSNVVVEGVIVQRAFFSNPPSECGDPPQLNRGHLLSANTFLSQDVTNEVDTAAQATEDAATESTQRSNDADVERDYRM